jgi:hypothetical protein
VDDPENVIPLTLVGVIASSDKLIAGVVVGLATVPEIPLAVVTETDVTVPLPVPPGGSAQVPSARRKLVAPPPDAGTTPELPDPNVATVIAGVDVPFATEIGAVPVTLVTVPRPDAASHWIVPDPVLVGTVPAAPSG